MNLKIKEIQEQIKAMGIDGWLLYDFQGLNPLAKKLLGIQKAMLTRRWYCWIPANGSPTVLCHHIERQGFEQLSVEIACFSSWREMEVGLSNLLNKSQRLAMEYSPNCFIPYVSKVDAGTVEMVRNLGKEIVSSADLIQYFEARWSEDQLRTHMLASQKLMQLFFEILEQISQTTKNNLFLTEYQVQQTMWKKFQHLGLQSSSPPIVAVNQNSNNPHYEPSMESSAEIKRGDFLLIDFWAKLLQSHSVYADYTWVVFLGDKIPNQILNVWKIVKQARDSAIQFVEHRHTTGTSTKGWEVDQVARKVISKAGFGGAFLHRTGHSIGENDHGNGANMDSLETKDERVLIPHTGFSIEPGIYLPEFGIRSEINIYLGNNDLRVTGEPIQQEILKI